jgi:hypothetical protein
VAGGLTRERQDNLLAGELDRICSGKAPAELVRLAGSLSLKATEQPIDTGTAAGKCFLDMLASEDIFPVLDAPETRAGIVHRARICGVRCRSKFCRRRPTKRVGGKPCLPRRQGAHTNSQKSGLSAVGTLVSFPV